MEAFKLGKKLKITMDMARQLENYEYSDMIRLAAVMKILQDDGVTPEVLENMQIMGRKYILLILFVSWIFFCEE